MHDADDEKSMEDTLTAALTQIEEKQYEANLIARSFEKEKIRIYIRADARADWKRTFYVITAANNAGISDIVFGSLPAKK